MAEDIGTFNIADFSASIPSFEEKNDLDLSMQLFEESNILSSDQIDIHSTLWPRSISSGTEIVPNSVLNPLDQLFPLRTESPVDSGFNEEVCMIALTREPVTFMMLM